MTEGAAGRTEKQVLRSLYLTMSNAKAIDQLLSLFAAWKNDPSVSFDRGLGRFKTAFQQLRAIRQWGPEDRVRDTGLLEYWQETLDVVGQSASAVRVEVELWHRRDARKRTEAEAHVEAVVSASGGRVIDRAQINEISYHAVLAELPIQQVKAVLEAGAESIQLLATEDIMFVSPFVPMSVGPGAANPVAELPRLPEAQVEGLPRVALLDGLPFQGHDALVGRLAIDDPDGLGANYPVVARNHGTAMASLIIHGDLSAPGTPLERPLYVRPIMRPHEFFQEDEQVVPDRLFTDSLHRAVRRIVEGDSGREASAPSVRVVNLSIGDPARALVRRMKSSRPAARLACQRLQPSVRGQRRQSSRCDRYSSRCYA